MVDTVDPAASSSSADGAEEPQAAAPVDSAEEPQAAASDGAEQPREARAGGREGEEERREEGEETEDDRSITELLERLGRQLSDVGLAKAQLEAARNLPEVRRAARAVAGALIVVVAALTGLAFLDVAAVEELSTVLAPWLAALALAAAWLAVGALLLFGFVGDARRWFVWLVGKRPPRSTMEELEHDYDAAGEAARATLEQMGPALAGQIAMAAVPDAGDVASGVLDMGGSVLDAADDTVDALADQIPGGGVANQVWDVALMPGRLGIRVVTTVLRRGRPAG